MLHQQKLESNCWILSEDVGESGMGNQMVARRWERTGAYVSVQQLTTDALPRLFFQTQEGVSDKDMHQEQPRYMPRTESVRL